MNVESVAWITQRKNVLSLFFLMVAMLWHLRFESGGGRRWYWLAVASFLAAMLSKGAVVAAPAVLLLCVWWLRGRIDARDALRSLPFFAISAGLSIVEIWFQYVRAIGHVVVRDDSFLARLAGAGQVVWFYLYKALLPINLCFVYPKWRIDPVDWRAYIPGLALLALGGLCWRYRQSWGRPLLFALGYYVLMLGPVLGFFDIFFMRFSLVADHYQYVAIAGIIALVAGVGCWAADRFGRWGRRVGAPLAIVVLATSATLTWRQSRIYRDAETLWRDTLRKNNGAWIAHNNLGMLVRAQGSVDEAISHYREALRLNPTFTDAHNNLGVALAAQHKLDEAIAHYRKALEIKPHLAQTHNNLASALLSQGKSDEAIEHFRQAVYYKPKLAEAHYNLGIALKTQGRLEVALGCFQEAARLKPSWELARQAVEGILAKHPDLGADRED